MIAFLIRIAYGLGSSFLFFYEKNRVLSIVSGINAVVNIVLNILLIPLYGIEGAAWATLSSFSGSALFVGLYSYRTLKVKSSS
jgi:O-antigen/teichoic acid export membrane protein